MRLLTAVTLLLLPSLLSAEVIFSNGAPNGVDGWNLAGNSITEDFSVSGPVSVDRVIMYGSADINNVASQFSGSMAWAFYDNDELTAMPGSLLFSGVDPAVELINNGTLNAGTQEYRFVIDVAGVELVAGTYWLVLQETAFGAPSDGTRIFWDTSGSGFGRTGFISQGSGWSPTNANHAFDIEAVPEPSTLTLLGGGAALLFALRRRR